MNANRMRGLLAVVAMCLPMVAMAQQQGSGVVELTGPGAGAGESFNALASTGDTGTALPTGWYFHETNTNANASYGVSNGSGGTLSGNTYSFGTTGSSERAFGSLFSGSLTPRIGARLQNASGAPLTEIAISYTGEQWRLGVASRSQPDRLDFYFSTNATSLLDGNAHWTHIEALSFTSPVTSGTIGALDGNLPANQTLISGTISGFTLQPGESLWIRWNDIDGPNGADDGLAIDDIIFGTPVDIPPFLADSFPQDGDTDFPTNASLILTFSEPVDVDGVWFEIQCAASGYYTPSNTTVSGGATVYTLTPNTPFLAADACELTLDTQLIVDQGSEGYELDDPGVIAFTTIAPPPNAPPQLVSTIPTQGADNFPSAGDLRAVFTEPVTTVAGAFSLECATTSGIVLVPSSSDGGVTWIIDTGTALVAGEACTFTIDAAFIHDLDPDDPLPLVAGAQITFTVFNAADTSAYYQNVNLSSPEQLRCTLHETIKGHTKYPYEWEKLEIADEAPPGICAPGNASSENYILDVYRNRCYLKVSARSNPVDEHHYNREHVWPRSLGFNAGNQTANNALAAHNDLHMLHLSASDHNGTRDNDPYDNCDSGCTAYGTDANNGVGGPGPSGNSNWSNDSVFEVWDEKKGDMARALFYMAIRYEGIASEDAHDGDLPDLELTDTLSLIQITAHTAPRAYMGKLSTLLQWHALDVPDERELQRTGVVQGFQGNRNPFIDHPEWGTLALFQSSQPTICTPNQNAPVAQTDGYEADEGTALTIPAGTGLLANDTDVEFAAAGSVPAGWFTLTVERLTDPAKGTLSLAANGSFTYTPATGFCGTDSFTYRTSDGVRWSAPATVTIRVGSDCIFSDSFEPQD